MNVGIKRKGLKSAADLAVDKPHGTRIKYMGGCKCDLCRKANSDYEKQRAIARKQGLSNGIVSANKAMRHLHKLSEQGVGYKSVCDVTNLGTAIVFGIYSGKKKKCRADTARKIMKVTPAMAADGAYIDAAPSWALINSLLAEGYTKVQVAEGIGQKRALQLGKQKITVAHAAKIETLFKCLHDKLGSVKREHNAIEFETHTQFGVLTRNLKSGHVVHRLI